MYVSQSTFIIISWELKLSNHHSWTTSSSIWNKTKRGWTKTYINCTYFRRMAIINNKLQDFEYNTEDTKISGTLILVFTYADAWYGCYCLMTVSREFPSKSTCCSLDSSRNSPYLMLNSCLLILSTSVRALWQCICYSREKAQFAFVVAWRPVNLQGHEHPRVSCNFFFQQSPPISKLQWTVINWLVSCTWSRKERVHSQDV